MFDWIQFSKFHTHNGDDTLPRLYGILAVIYVISEISLHEPNLGLLHRGYGKSGFDVDAS